MNEEKKYPEGHFKGICMTLGFLIFAGAGIPLSIVTKNMSIIGIGSAVGVLLGMVVGESVEKKYAEKGLLRPMNEKEIRNKKNQIKLLLLAGLIGFFILVYYQIK
ncbi:MAG: hypothetical protein JXR36_06215 [Bacteroidales bacterium]|nr:hypothetical protein [Bacteroidales bacterium]